MKQINAIEDCPLRKAINVLGGKWNLIILKSMGKQELRFNEIKKRIPDISEKVLIDKLKILTSYDIIIRKNFNEVPPKVSYKLSKHGFKTLSIIQHLEDFGKTLKTKNNLKI